MFELFYAGRVIEFIEKYPRESIAGLTAVIISHQITSVKTEKAKLETAKIERECELIRLETAKLEAQNNTTK